MAKNRNKKKKQKNDGAVDMDTTEQTVSDFAQAMDTSESGVRKPASDGLSRKVKGRPMKRSKSVRKMKAVAKAIAQNEKSAEKIFKSEGKMSRTQSAKLLYE